MRVHLSVFGCVLVCESAFGCVRVRFGLGVRVCVWVFESAFWCARVSLGVCY